METRRPIQETLCRHALFRGLSQHELGRLAEGSRELHIGRQEVLFQRGDNPDGMHVVVSGQVKLAIPSPNGAEKVVHMCGPGSIFGEDSVFLDKPYPVSALATETSVILMIAKAVLLEMIEASPAFSRKMLANLSMRVHELLDDMEACTLRSCMQRVACFLIQLVPVGRGDGQELLLPASKQTIASQLNLAPETFSRVLGHLSEQGIIRVNGRTITILDRTRLLASQA